MDINKRLAKLKKSVENSNTPQRMESNRKIFERILKYIRETETQQEFYALLLKDYGAFAAWFIDGKDEPFMAAPWQIKAAYKFKAYNRAFFLNCRRSGKTTWAASVIVWDMCSREHANHLIFAPTKQQLIIMEEVFKIINNNEFFLENFVQKGTNRHMKIEFQVNSSSVEAFNIGVQGQGKKGDYLRGMGGNVVWIDEIGLVDADVRKEVINPIIRDAYGDSEKKLVLFGTPKLAYNPELETEWETAKDRDYWATIQVHCWQSLKEGIRTPQMMREVFDDLQIPCKHVQTHGVCPEFAPEMLEGTPSGWTCDQDYVCMDNDTFMMEDMAAFPQGSDRFFPRSWLEDTRAKYDWYKPTQIEPNQEYVMAIDLGLLQDPTEIVVAEVVTDSGDGRRKLRYAAWKSIDPWKEGETVQTATLRHINDMKRVYHTFNPKVIYVDVTRGTDYASRLWEGALERGELPNIPKSRFYANEAMKKKDGLGCWWDGHFKSKIYLNHKDQLQKRNIEVPHDPVFWNDWWNDHYDVKAEPAHGGTYLQFGKKSRHLLDAAAMLSWYLYDDGPKKKSFKLRFIAD